VAKASLLSFLMRRFVGALYEWIVGIELKRREADVIRRTTERGSALVASRRSLGNIGDSLSAKSLLAGCEFPLLDPACHLDAAAAHAAMGLSEDRSMTCSDNVS
jgi:hypothetical protein